jgi:hypothetical protein
MNSVSVASPPRPGWQAIVGALTWRRPVVAALLALIVAAALNPIFVVPFAVLLGRMMFIAALLLLVFSVAGAWQPARLRPWLLQVLAVVVTAPFATLLAYLPSVDGNVADLLAREERVMGIVYITCTALAQARSAQLAFALERSTLEKEALDACAEAAAGADRTALFFSTHWPTSRSSSNRDRRRRRRC